MQCIHVLRVDREAPAFAGLIDAVRADGGRVGTLVLDDTPELPPALAAAAGTGVLRAVAVGGGRSVAVKPLRSTPVLQDLLREHFLGCRVVLVRGENVEAPLLQPADTTVSPPHSPQGDDAWSVRDGDGAWTLSSEQLAARLRRPRPWGEVAADEAPTEEPLNRRQRRAVEQAAVRRAKRAVKREKQREKQRARKARKRNPKK